jgi:site-specific DNA-methyltransferase (adenine-specific)
MNELLNKITQGDCLEVSDRIESGSVDLILTDLPYGTMEGQSRTGIYHQGEERHAWDLKLPTEKIYDVANRILRKNGRMILFCQSDFTFELYNKAIPNLPYSYKMIWEKDSLGSFMRSKKAPLYQSEDILVFSKSSEAIPPHDFEGVHPLRNYFKTVAEFTGLTKKQIIDVIGQRADHTFRTNSTQYSLCTEKTYDELVREFSIDKMDGFKEYAELKNVDTEFKQSKESERLEYLARHNEQYPSTFNLWDGAKYKSNILKYKKDYDGFHPTQKPVLLLEDLIKTFSNERNLVVDLTCGSASTCVAAINTNRQFIGIEREAEYVEIGNRRIAEALKRKEDAKCQTTNLKHLKRS